ncbi:putative defense protein 2 [Asterias rubens]|uniref:putative defense protein 2 n=1 Tax=Asterias rubens TaxID=7604 RepID=UPI0014558F44|nr:putative defense protein 2 [Asterias rubens]
MATLSALFLLSTVVGVLGFPNGPPLAQCPGMIPAGHGPSNAVGPPPYNITTSALNYSVGSTLDVTISSDNGTIFKGFFLQARRIEPGSDTTVAIGTFSDIPTGTQTLDCNLIPNSAWGHSNNENKTSITANWNAPLQAEGDIAFRATIVSGVPDLTFYWTDVMSLTVDGPPRATDLPMTTSGVTAVKASALLAVFVSMGAYLTSTI